MSQELNNLFRNDPHGFARTNALWPGDAEGVNNLQPGVSTNYFSAKAPIGTGQSLFQLKGEKRIWRCDLNRVGSRVILSKAPGAVTAPAMAIYYLPWAKDQMLRTTLRRTQAQALRGAKAPIHQNVPNAAAAPPQDTNDPDIFFTAGVNGCMVVVEGTREEPTVYHCNAITAGGSPLRAALEQRDGALAQTKIAQKVNWMGSRMTAMSTAAPKAPKGVVQTGAARKATIQTDYMMLAVGGELGDGEEGDWGITRANIERTTGIRHHSDKHVRIEKSVGTVFGARKNGMWTFYFQKLVCYEVWRRQGTIRKTWQKDVGDLWYVAHCREFWPNGGGIGI